MTIIWMTLIAGYLLALFSRFVAVPGAIGPVYAKPNKFFAGIVMLIFIVTAGLRRNIGDTYFYMHTYTITNFTLGSILSKKEAGFGLLQMVLKKYSSDPQILVFVTALITNLLVIAVLYKYSRMFELSIYLYVTSGLFIVSMNGIRQFLAASILFAATQFAMDSSWKKYMAVVLLASTVHVSALIMLPIYFIARREAWTKMTFLLIILAIFIVLGYNQLSGVLFSALEDTQYSVYKDSTEGGANIIRVVVGAIPIVIAYMGRKRLKELFPQSDFVINMSLLSVVFMVIATQNWIFARFDIYFGLYNLILFSWIIKVFAKRYQGLVYYMVVLFYFLYSYYENVITLNLVYHSDYIKL